MRCRWCRCEGQAWGMRGAVPPAAWAFAILVASDMLFLRRFPGEFAPFAFSQCAHARARDQSGELGALSMGWAGHHRMDMAPGTHHTYRRPRSEQATAEQTRQTG